MPSQPRSLPSGSDAVPNSLSTLRTGATMIGRRP